MAHKVAQSVSGAAKTTGTNFLNLSKQDTPKVLFGMILGLLIAISIVGITYLLQEENQPNTLEMVITSTNPTRKLEATASPSTTPLPTSTPKATITPTVTKVAAKLYTFKTTYRDSEDIKYSYYSTIEYKTEKDYRDDINITNIVISGDNFELRFEPADHSGVTHLNDHKKVGNFYSFFNPYVEGNIRYYTPIENITFRENCDTYNEVIKPPCGIGDYLREEDGTTTAVIQMYCTQLKSGGYEACDAIMKTLTISSI